MSDGQKFYQLPAFTLAGAGCAIGDTSIILSSMLDSDGNQVQMTDLGAKCWGTLEPSNSTQEEQISFTGITLNSNGTVTLTGVKNVAFKSPYTETSGVLKTHPGGAKFIISNTSGFYDDMTSKSNDETITGLYTFTQSPQTPTPTIASQVATKGYVDGVAIAGGAKASSTVIGLAELSVDPVTASVPIAIGQNDPVVSRIPSVATQAALVGDSSTVAAISSTNVFVTQQGLQRMQEIYVSTPSGNSSALTVALNPTPVALIGGMLVAFKSNLTTAASPTLNINGLGAKSLVKASSTGTSVLAAGDITTGVLVLAEYNGSEWQMLSKDASSPFASAAASGINGIGTGTTDTVITHGLGKLPNLLTVSMTLTAYGSSSGGVTVGTIQVNSAGTIVGGFGVNQLGSTTSLQSMGNLSASGSGASFYNMTVSIINITSTQFTIRCVQTVGAGSPNTSNISGIGWIAQ